MREFSPPRGTRDIFGEEAELYEYLFKEFRETARKFGFEPIITPTIEHFALFEAKSGEEIKRSMYVFEDKAGRLLALRPEVTASVVRAYLQQLRARPKPIRLYYIAQCFRYEEPQYARYREFWQGGLEVIGDPDVNADVLAAYAASSFLEKVGVKHFYEVGNVAIYRAFMSKLGLSEELQDHILHLIDKDRVDEALSELRTIIGEGADVIAKLVNAKSLDAVESIINEYRELLGDSYAKVVEEQERLYNFLSILKELGFNATYQPKLVRGLAYYTGLIFEYKLEGAPEAPSIGGGGRYDGLTQVYGGPYEPSTGLALGIDRIALALKGVYRVETPMRVVVVVMSGVPLSIGYRALRNILSSKEGAQGFVLRAKSLSKALEYSNKLGVDYVVILGEREYKENAVTIKNMKTGEQFKVSLEEVGRNV
ncbi:MAG: histidine--tRNA ligase [Desulfurococcaceae archaeon]|nr:histidine--tRNA ligase [Desulfurococcaceae archaeon]